MLGLQPPVTQRRLLLGWTDEPSLFWKDVGHLLPNNMYPGISHTLLWALGPLCGHAVGASSAVATPPSPLGRQRSGAGHQPWVLELGVHVRFIPAMAGWPLLMLTLCYNLQGHLQLALWGQGGPDQGHKASSPWLGEEPGQDRCQGHCTIFFEKWYRVIWS